MRADWRTVRAFAIALVLALGFVAGWPRRIEKLVRPWPKPLAALALRLPELQAKLLAPFTPVAEAFGVTSEDWPLFTGTGGTRYRMWLEVQGKPGRAWKLLYRAHDPEHRYFAGGLEYRRVLNIWNPHHAYISDAYPGFARGLARRIFRADRRLLRLRIRMEEVTIRAEGRGFLPTGRYAYEIVLGRDEVEP
jgi:hypothetical protein